MFQIVLITIVCALLVIYLKSVNSELFPLALLGSCILILGVGINYLSEAYNFFNKIISKTGLDSGLVAVILKITAIGYIVEFGAGVVEDLGLKSLADKLVFVGKISILIVSIPVFYAIFNLINQFI